MNLARIIERHAAFAPGQVALHFEGEDISYPQLWQRVEQATAVLQSAGVRPGDRVAWLGLNDPSMLVLLFGLARIGAILLPLNYRLAAAEHTAILAHAGAGMLVADETHAAVAEALCAAGGPRSMSASALQLPSAAAAHATLQGHDDAPVLLVYTSG